jgi:hypothetical protein
VHNNRAKVKTQALLLCIALIFISGVSLGQSSVQYGDEIKTEPSIRYGAEIEKQSGVQYGVDISVDDIRQVAPDEIVPEEVPSNFEFSLRNYISISGYYDDLMEYPDINPDNILELEETAYFLEANTQFDLAYLEDYMFKGDISYQWSPGSDEQSDRDTHFITNEFFFDFYVVQSAYLKAGKKRESWGVGWTFSPVDNIIDLLKNPVDPTESREGMYLSMLVVPVGNASFSFVYFPYVEFDMFSEKGQSGIPKQIGGEEPAYGVRASFLFWDTDISLIYYRTDKIPDLQKNYYGITLNRYWLDFGAYVEIEGHEGNDLERVQKTATGQYYFPVEDELVDLKKEDDDIFVNFALGSNYTFSDDSKIALEYYRNNEGYDDDEFDDFFNFVDHEALIHRIIDDEFSEKKLLKANQLLGDRIRQNYLSFSFDRPNTFDDFFPHLGLITCLDDGSFLLNGVLAYNARDDTSISLDVRGYFGDSDTEWGMKPDNYRVFLKLKYYF